MFLRMVMLSNVNTSSGCDNEPLCAFKEAGMCSCPELERRRCKAEWAGLREGELRRTARPQHGTVQGGVVGTRGRFSAETDTFCLWSSR